MNNELTFREERVEERDDLEELMPVYITSKRRERSQTQIAETTYFFKCLLQKVLFSSSRCCSKSFQKHSVHKINFRS